MSKGLVEGDLVYVVASGRVVVMWHALEPVVEIHRVALGATKQPWQSFEALYRETVAYMHDRGADVHNVASGRSRV